MFQSTHPHGVRRWQGWLPPHLTVVSIHAPARGATVPSKNAILDRMFQSTHPHGVRPEDPDGDRHRVRVSIHAPARGATPILVIISAATKVSIHAPARGATCDHCYGYHYFTCVSIHAPARGATATLSITIQIPHLFQSTHPHGVRR